MKLTDAIKALNASHENKDALTALRKEVGPLSVLVKDEGGKLDAAEILDALRHCERTGEAGVPGGQTIEQWLTERAPEQEACPVTRRPLYKNKVQVERPPLSPLVVDWSGISRERRLVAAYRAEVQGFSDPDLATAALRMADLPLDWRTAERDQRELFAVQKPTPHQRELRERIDARLSFQKEPAASRSFGEPSGLPSALASAPSTIVGSADAPPLFVILCNGAAKNHATDLKSHLSPYVRAKIMRVWTIGDIPAGAVRSALIARQLGDAKVVVHLCEARYLNSSFVDCDGVPVTEFASFDHLVRLPPLRILEEALNLAPTARHVPVLLTTCDLSYSALSGKRPLPRNEKPVTLWGDRDSAWSDVAQGLRQIAVSLS